LTQLCPGTYTFTWDGTANQTSYPPNNIAPTGLYTFDIAVQGACPYDTDKMRSSIISVSQTSLDIEEDKYKFGYYFESSDGSLPSKAEVTVYGPAIDNFKKYWGPEEGGTNLGWNYVSFPIDTIEVGGEHSFVVVSGWDSDVNNKAHNHKPFRERNKNPKLATAALFYAEYEWVCGGKDTQGNTIWIPVQYPPEEAAKYWKKCVDPAKAGLTAGAFRDAPPEGQKPKLTGFSPYWDKHFPMLQPTERAHLAAYALQKVNVFAFAGHGDGNYMEFVQFTYADPYNPYVISSISTEDGLSWKDGWGNKQPITSLSNLHLVVIGSCRLASISGFPIVAAIVSKGAHCGIGVGGVGHEDFSTGEICSDWNLLYSISYEKWAEIFWKITSAEGDAEAKDWAAKWPKMQEAAKRAMYRANERYLKVLSKTYCQNMCVYVAFSGQDDYLGNIPGTF
jgi:hypothetical protein